MTRTKTVRKNIKSVKTLHVLMTLVWPLAVIFVISSVSYLYRAYFKNNASYYYPIAAALFAFWLLYVYFTMIMMRNYSLQIIATEECDFYAYLECVKYLEKFQLPTARRSQRINQTDAYLLIGDFDAAYRNLMEMKPEYERCGSRTRMLYDYFWCRFYADLEDMRNFRICRDVFCRNWIQNPQVRRKLQRQAGALLQELNFRDIMFAGGNDRIKADMMNLYETGMLGSRYEFVRYCYYMGRLEYNMNNLQIAKHWFAQTVSFGLQESMSRRAADFLAMLDAMQVPYAATPPARNQYYCNRRNFSMAAGIFSILAGLFFVVAVILYG